MLRKRTAALRRPIRFVRRRAVLLVLAAIAAGLLTPPIVAAAEGAASNPNPLTTLIERVAASTSSASDSYGVTALFQVSRNPLTLLGDGGQPTDEGAWKTYCATQVELTKCSFVLGIALRDPKVASLPMLADKDDPVTWIGQQLQVAFLPDSEILAISMPATGENLEQVSQIVQAVAESYLNEVVFTEEQRRLVLRDALAMSLSKLNDEITQKMEQCNALAKELNVADRDIGQVTQQLDITRLERIEDELMRLEDAALRSEISLEASKEPTAEQTAESEFYKRRIKDLEKRQKTLHDKIESRSERSVDLALRAQDVEQLQQIAKAMSIRLQVMNIEASAPPRIRLIQKATIAHE